MKRVSQSFYPNCIIRTLPTDKSHPHTASQPSEKCPRDVGTSYVTVPVYKMNEKFSKRQIKDAANVYTVQSCSSHSFVLSLKSDPSTHIAVPYYRTVETNTSGRQFVSVSNFFPASTLQATPPPGLNM